MDGLPAECVVVGDNGELTVGGGECAGVPDGDDLVGECGEGGVVEEVPLLEVGEGLRRCGAAKSGALDEVAEVGRRRSAQGAEVAIGQLGVEFGGGEAGE